RISDYVIASFNKPFATNAEAYSLDAVLPEEAFRWDSSLEITVKEDLTEEPFATNAEAYSLDAVLPEEAFRWDSSPKITVKEDLTEGRGSLDKRLLLMGRRISDYVIASFNKPFATNAEAYSLDAVLPEEAFRWDSSPKITVKEDLTEDPSTLPYVSLRSSQTADGDLEKLWPA
nr:hypothetical protein [Tanacetum cinerariifolium]